MLGWVGFFLFICLDADVLGDQLKYFAKSFTGQPLQSGKAIAVLAVEAAVAIQGPFVDLDRAESILAARCLARFAVEALLWAWVRATVENV